MSGLLITGTDTGVGKTLVACGLAACLTAAGRTVGVMKPVETGCETQNGELFPEDAVLLARFAGSSEPLEELCPYRFAPPVAPSVAADQAGVTIRPERIVSLFQRISHRHDTVLVEGAGGLLVPLVDRYTFADLARDLDIPLLVVVGSKLGALNHTLLTLGHALAQSLPLQGYIMNHPMSSADPATRTNSETLARLTDVACLGSIPHLSLGADSQKGRRTLLAAFKQHLNVDQILG